MKPRRRRRRRQPGRADAGVALPTELVLEIIERASPTAAVRCAATCKPWLRLVSRRSFVRRASRPRRALLLGFFVFDHADNDEQEMLQPRFVPCPGGPAGWRCPCSPRLDPRCLDMDPVLSRNGYLVLRRVALAKPAGAGMPTAINYCVCNPATGSCYFLPPYHVDQDIGFWEYSCALLTDRDFKHRVSSSSLGSFDLVVAAIPTERQELLVSVFSSRTMQWSSVRSVEIPMYNRAWKYLEMHPRPPPAVVHGVVCWQCTGDCTERVMLALDLRRHQWSVDLLDLPNQTRSFGACWDFGLLLGCRDDGVLRAFAMAEGRSTLTMWAWLNTALGSRSTWAWRPSGEIDLRTAITEALGPSVSYSGGEDSHDVGVKLLWYCEKSNVLVFSTAALGNFALDLDTERAEPLGKILRCKSESCARYACIAWRACPYEMDCPPHWITSK
jgi:hypothetical protein